jgi:hypothetical protein
VNQKGSRFQTYCSTKELRICQVANPLGTTWRPVEVATTSWAPSLKPSATKLSKNITTLTVHIASNLSANNSRFPQPATHRTPNPLITNELSYRSPSPKTLPLPHQKFRPLYPFRAVSYSREGLNTACLAASLDVYCVDNPAKLSYAKSSRAG